MKNPFLAKIITIAIWIIGLILACISAIKHIKPLFIVAAVFLFGSVIFEAIFLRCPHCNKMLSSVGRLGDYCQFCGGRLDGED